MRKSTPVVSSGEAASYDSDSKQTIPGPVRHLAEIEEAVALAASPFSLLHPQGSIRPRKKPAELRQAIYARLSRVPVAFQRNNHTATYDPSHAVVWRTGGSRHAINYAKFRSHSHDAVIRVYDEAGNV